MLIFVNFLLFSMTLVGLEIYNFGLEFIWILERGYKQFVFLVSASSSSSMLMLKLRVTRTFIGVIFQIYILNIPFFQIF